jgi:hypothetical protein
MNSLMNNGFICHVYISPYLDDIEVLPSFRGMKDCLRSFVGEVKPFNNPSHVLPLWF